MSQINVDNIKGRTGGAVSAPAGIVVTGVGTFTGNVSVGGTLTYEDVTNVDSVGLITARNGIRIGTGGTVGPVGSGIVTYFGDGSQLTGIQAGVANFVATGTVANGAPVIVKDDGTVGSITQTTDPSSNPNSGTPVVFEIGTTETTSVSYDSNAGKVVVAYKDAGNGNYGTCVVGTVNPDDTITFGSAVVFNAGQTDYIVARFDPVNNKVVIAYQDIGGSSRGTCIVGTVSGNSISFGSEVQFSTDNTRPVGDTSMTHIGGGKFFIAFTNATNSSDGDAIVGTVSGNSISFGSVAAITSNQCYSMSTDYDANAGKVVVAYRDGSDSNKGKARVATVSGTSISFGTEVIFNSGGTLYPNVVYDSSSQKVAITYRDSGNSNYGTAIVGTVSGTNISFGSEVVFESASVTYLRSVFDSTNNKIVAAYGDSGNSTHGTVIVGAISGTSISFNSPAVFQGAEIGYTGLAFIGNGKSVVSYRNNGNNNYGTACVLNSLTPVTNLTTGNYIGIAAGAISNAASGSITISGGINESQTGLTTGRTYYVQGTGTLSTTPGNPSVVAGTSISSTKIIVKG